MHGVQGGTYNKFNILLFDGYFGQLLFSAGGKARQL